MVRKSLIVSTIAITILIASGTAVAQDISVDLSAPSDVTVGETATISSTVSVPDVTGDHEANLDVELYVNGEQQASRSTTISDGETVTFDFDHTFQSEGDATVEVRGSATVETRLGSESFSDSISTTVNVQQATDTSVSDGTDTDLGDDTDLRDQVEQTSVTGAAFTVPESLEDEVQSYRERDQTGLAPHAFVLANENELYVVFTSSQPERGRAEVSGRAVSRGISHGGLDFGVIVASSASFETQGDRASINAVKSNPEQYQYDLVRIDAPHRRVSILTDPDGGSDYTLSTTAGALTADPMTATDLFGQPAAKARWILTNTSEGTSGSGNQVMSQLLGARESRLATFNFVTEYWLDAETETHGVVILPGDKAADFVEQFDQSTVLAGDEPLLYVIDASFDSSEHDDVASIADGASDGDLVSVEAKFRGKKISVQETLRANTGCGESQVEVQTPSGPSCVDLAQDTLVEAGVAWNDVPQDRDDLLFVTGLSSQHLDEEHEDIDGRYRIRGEVVSTARFDDSLPEGKILIAYDLERTGDIDYEAMAQEAKDLVEKRLDGLDSALDRQLAVSAEAGASSDAGVTSDGGEASDGDTSGDDGSSDEGDGDDSGGSGGIVGGTVDRITQVVSDLLGGFF